MIDREHVKRVVTRAAKPLYRGRISRISGILAEADMLPSAIGEVCRIGGANGTTAETVGFRDGRALLMPHGDLAGIAPGTPVTALGHQFEIGVGSGLLGRVIDGFGRPLDERPLPALAAKRAIRAAAPLPLERPPIDEPLQTGVRVIDGLLTIGRGQRLGIFAGSGVGKSTLLGQITSGTDADVVVIGLVGERGREVRAFIDDVLDEERRARAVTVVATSDRPPIERFYAPFSAVTVAEYFRDQGLDVLLVMDSVTRFAAATREIGLAAGEPPTLRGYPPSFFATTPQLVERLGRTKTGSITGLFTVLLDGDDINDPVGDTLRGLLDGHLVLDRALAHKNHFPAVDVLGSISRLMPELATREHMDLAAKLRTDLATFQESRDLIEIGAYKAGSNPKLDRAIARRELVEMFLRQARDERTSLADTHALLATLFAEQKPAPRPVARKA
jgi:flagellum-specific ATP synthase/type III secretion protein N (ATPase)